jgi:hypothetical protein
MLADTFRKAIAKDYAFDDEEYNRELVEGDTTMLTQAMSYKTSTVVNWLIDDFINAQNIAINYDGDYWTEQSLIELLHDFIEALDASKDFSISDLTQKTERINNSFSLELSSMLVNKSDGNYFWVRQSMKELLINSSIGEINTRLHNIKHEKLGE